jgi:hypothetical protein
MQADGEPTMSMSTHIASPGAFGAPRARAGDTAGIAHWAIAALCFVIVGLLFAVSSGLLWNLGINYNGIEGAAASKIHPATYLAFFTFGLLIIGRRNPASFFVGFVTRYPGALAFLFATLMLAAYIVLDGRKGIATIFDTYLLAVMVVLILAELSDREVGRVEKLLHVLLAVNAAIALVEYLIDYRFFPFRFDGAAFEWDKRSTALLGHPLENAQVTGLYILTLLGGGGTRMPRALRPWAVLLQLAALVSFGGRTALVLTLAMAALWSIPRVIGVLRGRRASLLVFAAIAGLIPMLALFVGLIAYNGFFDVLMDRFADDGGSANSRLEMFEVLGQLSGRDILIGASGDVIDSMRRTSGLEWGIENPVVRLLLYQGAIFTVFLIAGFALFLFEIAGKLRPGARMAFVFFIIVINSYESISNKAVGLAQFVVLVLVMFHPSNSASRTGAEGPRVRGRGPTQPSRQARQV